MVITPFPRSSVCLITAEHCHLFVFSTHDRPLPSPPWGSQPSAVPIQMGIKVQFYFTVLSSLQQIFSDSVFWLLNCSVLSDWSKTSVFEIKATLKGYWDIIPKVWKVLNTKLVSNRRELLGKLMHLTTWILQRASFPGKFCQLPHNTGSRASKYLRLHFSPFPPYLL